MVSKTSVRFLTAVLIASMMTAAMTFAEKKMNQPDTATFAGGCFWCMQPPFDAITGVISTVVGYTGGTYPDPSYENVCTGKTGHAEAIQIIFDQDMVTYDRLLDVFWRNIDPTTRNGQFADRGSQYRTAIFYHDENQGKLAGKSRDALEHSGKFDKPVVTEITPTSVFYPAEEYHQNYYKKQFERYRRYKTGSGRDAFLRKTWGEKD